LVIRDCSSPHFQENIDNFLKVVEKLGVPAGDKFQTEDLFYGNNIAKVVLTVLSFANAIQGQFSAPAVDTSGLDVRGPPFFFFFFFGLYTGSTRGASTPSREEPRSSTHLFSLSLSLSRHRT
jgi:hypothetical protein